MKKIFLACLFVLGAQNAFSQEESFDENYVAETERITYVTGYGRDSATCRNSSSSFCVDTIKRRAEDYGKYDARRRCETQRGQVVGIAYCNSVCTPGYIPPGNGTTYVICDANCQVRCEVPN